MTTDTTTREQAAAQFITSTTRGIDAAYGCLWSPGEGSRWIPLQHGVEHAAVLVAQASEDIYWGTWLADRAWGRKVRLKKGARPPSGVLGAVIDLDVAHGRPRRDGAPEAKRRFPSTATAADFAYSLPRRPSLIVDTGGGLHAWWLFEQPWMFSDVAEQERAARTIEGWVRLVQARARAVGVDVDSTYDFPRLMRIPGGMNHKYVGDPLPVQVWEAQ